MKDYASCGWSSTLYEYIKELMILAYDEIPEYKRMKIHEV
jgi:hypothetical protein